MKATEALLRQLAAHDERCLQAVLSPDRCAVSTTLDRETWALVRLSALLAVDATTASLRWAVDVATSLGVDDEALVQVLLTSAAAGEQAHMATSAPRLALALGFDLEGEAGDGE